MLTAILHLSYSVISFIVGLIIIFFSSLKKGKTNANVIYFGFFFLLFSIYRLLLSSYLFIKDPFLVKEIYLLAVLVFFVMITLAERTALRMMHCKGLTKSVITLTFILLAVITTSLQLINFNLPTINENGFIYWNMDIWSSWIAGISGFAVAMTWVYVFMRNIAGSINTVDRIKSYLIAFAAMLMGISSLTYFHSNYYALLTAFITALAGVISVIFALLLPYVGRKWIKEEK